MSMIRPLRLLPNLRIRFFSTKNPHIAPGSAPNVIPTNWENLTGKARIEYEAELKGKKVLKYLDYDGNDVYTPTRMGTKKDPMMIKAYGDVQYVGCSGNNKGQHSTSHHILSYLQVR
jgi:hypothetical protein